MMYMDLPALRYVRILGNVVHAIQIKTKLCQLVEVMMERRDDLSFCQEMKFRLVTSVDRISIHYNWKLQVSDYDTFTPTTSVVSTTCLYIF